MKSLFNSYITSHPNVVVQKISVQYPINYQICIGIGLVSIVYILDSKSL